MRIKIILLFTLLLMANIVLIAQTPEWEWATQAGGINDASGFAIITDDDGNNYVTGRFEGTATFGFYSLTSSGDSDIFVAKMDANGTWLWAANAGGNGGDIGLGITIDDAGYSYITGKFQGTATFGSHSITSSGEEDIFIAKLDLDGNWQWAASAGGTGHDRGSGITIDDAGNCYIIGTFSETATFGTHTLSSIGNVDIFVARVSNGIWQWAARAGGVPGLVFGTDSGTEIAIDNAGNCYVTGTFGNWASFGSHTITGIGYNDIFVAKINSDGSWQWANWAASGRYDAGCDITIDDGGNCYITGYFEQTAAFGSFSLTLTSSGGSDIFVAKMDSDGNWLWATKAGGTLGDVGAAITIDDAGNSYVTGHFYGTATFGSYSLTGSGYEDIFVAKINANGNWLWATKAGGSSSDWGRGIIIDDAGNCFITGGFSEMATFGSHSLTSNGDADIFVAKLNNNISYDLTFNSLADMNTARYGFAYANDGEHLYAICGATYEPPHNRVNNIEKYDPTTNNWIEFVDGLIPRIWSRAEYIQSSDNIYILGGLTGNTPVYSDIVQVVDVSTGNVTNLTSDHILSSQAGSAVWNNKIYVFGGTQESGYSNELYEFNPINNVWTQLTDMPEAKETEGEVADGILYVFGGYSGSVSNRIDAYDIQNDEWSFIGNMPAGISAHHITVSGKYIWLIGDFNNLNFVAVFNIETHEFTQLSNNMIGRRHCGTEVIGNNLYVYGGNVSSVGPALSSLQYAEISPSSINDDPNVIHSSITLFQNYPNPFNPETTISFSIKHNSKIELAIFNIKGEKVKTLINEFMQSGNHSIFWNGIDNDGNKVSSGLYFYILSVNGRTEDVKKCLLLK